MPDREKSAALARERATEAWERALRAHGRAAELHKRAADFHEVHAAGERALGRDHKAEVMERRADRERELEQLERIRGQQARGSPRESVDPRHLFPVDSPDRGAAREGASGHRNAPQRRWTRLPEQLPKQISGTRISGESFECREANRDSEAIRSKSRDEHNKPAPRSPLSR